MLSKRLMILRKKRKKTQKEVADYIGVSRPAYTNYEKGTRSPDRNTLSNIADYLNTNVDFLLGRTEDDSPTNEFNNYKRKVLNEYPFYNNNNYEFIVRSENNLSPDAYRKLQKLAKKAAEIFEEKST